MDNYQKIIFELIAIQKWDGVKEILTTKQKSINPDSRDSAGNYLIHLLMYHNQIELIKLLLLLEPRLDLLDPEGKQICYLPIRYNQIETLKLILKYNEINYGIDITNFRDCEQLSPLFYCVKFNNYECAKILLDNGSRLNTFDKKQNTALHIACSKGKIEFIKLFINYYPDIIQFINIDKQIPLHSSILSDNKDIIKLLLKYSEVDSISTQDINDRTPLMYAIELQKLEFIKELIKNISNTVFGRIMELQDGDGNTHYHLAIKYNIDLNLFPEPTLDIAYKTNIDGNTILHLLLANNLKNYFPDILKNSSFLIQNNNGDTVLHYLLKDTWIEYKDILEKQKLSIFLINKDKLTPYLIVKNSKYFNEFIDIVTKAYYYQLTLNNKKEYLTKWENDCSLKKIKLNQCELNIKDNINKGISFPQKKINYCINVTKKMADNKSIYSGITLDIISGLLILNQLKEKIQTTLDLDIISNKNLESYYQFNKIIRTDFLNFEIIWIHQSIFFPVGLDELFSKFIDSKNRYFVIPIGIELAQGSHANILIYDKELNMLERFEPNGSKPPNNFFYFPDELDIHIYQYFSKYIPNLEYLTPIKSSPAISFQRYEIIESNSRISDPGGYCGAWCAWYAYQRINNGISITKLIPKLLQKIRGNNISFKQIIRNYANIMANNRDKILKKSNLTIEDWFDSITNDDLEKIQSKIRAV